MMTHQGIGVKEENINGGALDLNSTFHNRQYTQYSSGNRSLFAEIGLILQYLEKY